MKGRVALVTGASRGIGRATALLLAKRGFDVAVHYRDNEEGAKKVLEHVTDRGVRGEIFKADFSKLEEIELLAESVLGKFGVVHVLVNNAGYSSHFDLVELSVDEWERSIRVHLTAPFLLSKKLSPKMKEEGWGRIVNVSSLRAFTGSRKGPHYASSKAGIIGLTKSLAIILSPFGITVNAVAPGYTRTDMTMPYLKEKEEEIANSIPLKRVAEPIEVAQVIAFLCSEDASYINGETILVNGGIYMK